MKAMSLFEFASNWELDYHHNRKADDRDCDDEQVELYEAPFLPEDEGPNPDKSRTQRKKGPAKLRRVKLNDLHHSTIKERLRPALISTAKFSPETPFDNFYYNLLVLFVPFSNERELILPEETPEIAFVRAHDIELLVGVPPWRLREIEAAWQRAHLAGHLADQEIGRPEI